MFSYEGVSKSFEPQAFSPFRQYNASHLMYKNVYATDCT